MPFVLTWTPSHPPAAGADRRRGGAGARPSVLAGLVRPLQPVGGEWAEAVRRSLITLKALTYAPTGGIVAAATTSLPEQLGGSRNWDYRYCWLRDATLTLLALMDAGYLEEAAAWRDWLLRAVAGSPDQLQIMYGLAGERRLTGMRAAAGCPATRARRRCASAMPPPASCSSTSMASCMDALHQARRAGSRRATHGWALERALVDASRDDLGAAR